MMMPTPTNTLVRLNSSPPLIATAMPATADKVPIAASTTCALLQIILRRARRFGEFQGSIGIGRPCGTARRSAAARLAGKARRSHANGWLFDWRAVAHDLHGRRGHVGRANAVTHLDLGERHVLRNLQD